MKITQKELIEVDDLKGEKMKKAMTILALFVLLTSLAIAETQAVMEVQPTSINETVYQTLAVPMTITNSGTAALNWDSDIVYPDDIKISISPYVGEVPENTYEPSTGFDHEGHVGYSPPHGAPELVLPRGSTAWYLANAIYYGTFDTDTPGTMNDIITSPGWISYAGDYSTESDDYFYASNPYYHDIYRIDAATGTPTYVGSTGLSDQINGMACDKIDGTMYACTDSILYTIDLSTGAATLVGDVGTSGSLLALACDGDQNLWAIDLDLDVLWQIDKDTGAGTQVGTSLGFDCTYAQSMSWDPATDVLFWAAYGGGLDGHLRVIDRSTGSSTSVGDFDGGREVTVLAFPGRPSRYIALEPSSGTIGQGGSMSVSCILDACDEPMGTAISGEIYFTSPQIADSVIVPVTFIVGNPGYGTLTGTVVTAAAGGAPIDSAMIIASDDADNEYVTYTNLSGVYTIDDIMAGYYTVECTADGYNYEVVTNVEIDADQTTTQNFELTAPVMEVQPTSINETVYQTLTVPMTITNSGTAALNWDSDIVYPDDIKISISPYVGEVPENTYESSAGLDSGNDVGYSPPHGDPELILPRGTTVWCRACEYASNPFYCTFDTDTPGDMTDILDPPAWKSFAGDYSTESDEYFYIADPTDYCIYTVNAATGIATYVGSTGLSDEQLDGMACDKTDGTMYACTSTSIYTIDLSTGAATLVGDVGTSGYLIALACDGDNLWAVDKDLDVLWKIDKDTGAGTQVGSLGFNCTYAQSMSWDPWTDILYWAAYSGGLNGHLRVIDRSTGNSTSVGDFEGGREVTVFAIPGVGPSPYITLEPSSGTVNQGGSMSVSCILDACDEPIGTAISGEIYFTSLLIADPVIVPVTFIVGNPGYGTLTGTVTAVTGGDPIDSAMIIALDDADNEYVTYTNSSGVYTIDDIMVDSYTVECTADGYNYEVVTNVEIVADQTTPLDFALTAPIMVVTLSSLNVTVPPGSTSTSYITIQNTGDGPMDFVANLYDYGKLLTDYSNCSDNATLCARKEVVSSGGNSGSGGFQVEGTCDEVIVHYDGENNNNGVGLNTGGTFMAAARFTSSELGSYYDLYDIISIKIYIYQSMTSLILKVWEGGSSGDPGSEVYSQDVTPQITVDSWNTIDLTTSIPLLSGNEYWVGYEITNASGYLPAGIDAGPAVDEKGDWIYLNSTWDELQNYSGSSGTPLDYNWNIRMVIDYSILPWVTIYPTYGNIPATNETQIAVDFDATGLTQGETKTADVEIISDPDVGTVIVPVTLTATVDITGGDPVVKETKLLGSFPNPMLNSTTFQFSLKTVSHVKLSIYNLKGQLVETLIDTEFEPSAKHTVEWNGTASGKALANGIYFYRLEADNKTFLKKMILMR